MFEVMHWVHNIWLWWANQTIEIMKSVGGKKDKQRNSIEDRSNNISLTRSTSAKSNRYSKAQCVHYFMLYVWHQTEKHTKREKEGEREEQTENGTFELRIYLQPITFSTFRRTYWIQLTLPTRHCRNG